MALSKILPASQEQFAGARNLIINGAMQVAQRGTSSTFSNGNDGYRVTDRWNLSETGSESFVFDVTQSTDAPDGFAYSYKLDCTTADTSLASNVQAGLEQRIEAQNLQHLNYGASTAKSMTLSFWVKSSKTGTYIIWIRQGDVSRSISASYTINSANTWEYKTLTIAGDTSGQINSDNGLGLRIRFVFFAGTDYTSGTLQTSWGSDTNADRYVGQVNLADTVGNEWYITGVQLEVGETATPFEHRSYGDELARCQRYFNKTFPYATAPANNAGSNGSLKGAVRNATTNEPSANWHFNVSMRTAPTVTLYNPGSGTSGQWAADGTSTSSSNARSQWASENSVAFDNTGNTFSNTANLHATADAEL